MEELGYLPEAVNNWVALMGWSYDGSTEFFTMDDLIEKFNVDKLNPKPSAINFTKLDHFNGLHIRSLALDDLARRIKPFFTAKGLEADHATLLKIAPILQERLKTLDDAIDMAGFFFKDQIVPAVEDLIQKKMTAADALQVAKRVTNLLETLPSLALEYTEESMRALVAEMGMKPAQFFGVIRVAVTGQTVSPPLFESMEIIGKDTVLARMRQAIDLLTAEVQQ
jgi:glutamyl-tRNA synthetase